MRKTDKKTERALVEALTRVCDAALARVPGFSWITHFVDYRYFPDSLLIVAVFETDDQLRAARSSELDRWLFKQIRGQLEAIDVPLDNSSRQLLVDSDEACERDNHGNWQERYR